MDHRWDESTLQDRAARGERERFGASRIEPDPDVERRDQMEMEARRRSINLSPWAIGEAWHDQRDLFTRNASMETDGYGIGPSIHPEDGSYAYHREAHLEAARPEHHSTLPEREAWPWLNYKEPEDDPYFAHLHAHEKHASDAAREEGWWHRLTSLVANTVHRSSGSTGSEERVGARLERAVDLALTGRRDLDSTDITVTVKGSDVTLEGTVTDRRSKHVAEEIAEGVQGVREVHNRLTIRREDPTDANVAFALPLSMMGV